MPRRNENARYVVRGGGERTVRHYRKLETNLHEAQARNHPVRAAKLVAVKPAIVSAEVTAHRNNAHRQRTVVGVGAVAIEARTAERFAREAIQPIGRPAIQEVLAGAAMADIADVEIPRPTLLGQATVLQEAQA